MADLGEAMNTYNPALQVLHELDYKVTVEPGTEEQPGVWGPTIWTAVSDKSGRRVEVSGHNPLSLLALAVIWDRFGENWRTERTPDWYNQIFDALGDE